MADVTEPTDEDIIAASEEYYSDPDYWFSEYLAAPSEYTAVVAIQAFIKSGEAIPSELFQYLSKICSFWLDAKGNQQKIRTFNTNLKNRMLFDRVNFILWTKSATTVSQACRLIDPTNDQSLARAYREQKSKRKK